MEPLLAAADHPYPLIRGGGLFLMCVGAGFLTGLLVPKHWIPCAIAGFFAGFVASGLSALLPSLGTPSVVQIAGLVGSFLLEAGLLWFVLTRWRDRDERTLGLAIVLVVGVHFITMGLAHGPLIAGLGVLCVANAGLGLLVPAIPLRGAYLVDALLKLGFGVWMFVWHPAFTFL